MIKISVTESDIEKLRYERFNHPHPLVQRKAETILLKSHDMSHKDICSIVGISGNTLRNYLRAWEQGGIEKIKEVLINQKVSWKIIKIR